MPDYTVLPLDKHVLQRRGTTTAINGYAGVVGEVLIDTTKNTVVLPSGTAGVNYPLAKESRAITAGAGISLTQGGSTVATATLAADLTVSADTQNLIAANDLLTVDANGKLAADFTLSYDASTGVFNVLGSDGTTSLASVTVPASTSALTVAELLVATPSSPVDGHTSGTYLHFQYRLSNNSLVDLYTDVSSLIDVYTAGDGISITNNQVSAVAGNGISVTSSGVAVKLLSSQNILTFDSNGNLYIDTTALHSETDQVIVSTDASNVVTAGTDGGALVKVAASGNALTVNASNELIVPLDAGVIS